MENTSENASNSFDFDEFRESLNRATNIVVFTGSGISAESGIPTTRKPTGLWRSYNQSFLNSLQTFNTNPSLAWEFFEWRRSLAFKADPNAAHLALVELEKKCIQEGRIFTLITNNIDGLHVKAGSQQILEVQGTLRKVLCTECGLIEVNTDVPICEALRNRSDADDVLEDANAILISDLPRCKNCKALLRPFITFFGEDLNADILNRCYEALEVCDFFVIVGTSSLMYPASGFSSCVRKRGIPIAQFNTDLFSSDGFAYEGLCSTILPEALNADTKNKSVIADEL